MGEDNILVADGSDLDTLREANELPRALTFSTAETDENYRSRLLDLKKKYEYYISDFLKEKLLNTDCFVKSHAEYLVVLGLYKMAGCEVWNWHKGYKPPEDDDNGWGLYVYKDFGFFKEIYPIPDKDTTVLSIKELFDLVMKGD